MHDKSVDRAKTLEEHPIDKKEKMDQELCVLYKKEDLDSKELKFMCELLNEKISIMAEKFSFLMVKNKILERKLKK